MTIKVSEQDFTIHAHRAWQSIFAASAADRAALCWAWYGEVVAAREKGFVSIREAAGLLLWPDDFYDLAGLGSVADLLIVLDTADGIVEGCAYFGVVDGEEHAWVDVAERIKRLSR